MKKVALLTFISNAGWDSGPGHSALVFPGVVWSFEGKGWRKVKPLSYVTENAFRPMIVQELNHKVKAQKVHDHVMKTMFDDYLFAGVCSSLCIDAISYGAYNTPDQLNANFGYDFPDAVALLVKKRKLVEEAYYVPATKETAKMKERREEDFSDLKPRKTATFVSW